MNYEKLGTKIRNRRLELNQSQEQIAESAKISPAYLGQLERAERKLSVETPGQQHLLF